ncbi:MAG: MAPEG family protein [Azoarcus sp.]|jgi:hypothetical protein|nr:MAPEG family protein [Azoarcus sp.]
MDSASIFLPSLSLMLGTYLVLVLIPWQRFRSYFRHEVGPEDFKCGESNRVPEAVLRPNRVFMNLLEMPVMFYAVSTMIFVTGRVDGIFIALAWCYVGLRAVHALVFLIRNSIFFRFLSFGISNVALLAMLIRFTAMISE